MTLKKFTIRKIANYLTLSTFSDENVIETPQTTKMPKDFEHNRKDDNDENQRRGKLAQFNNELTLAMLCATQG